MKAAALDICLAVAVASVWLGCFGALRLRSALDRLHAVAFVNAAGGIAIAAAAFVDEGVTTRSVKLAALVVVVLVMGSAVNHAAGRALMLRDGPQA